MKDINKKDINKKVITDYETCTMCQVYNYTPDIVKEMKQDGWVLERTYYRYLIFRKGK